MADDDQYEEKRKDLVKFIQEAKGSEDVVTLVGIDHGFSFLKFGTVIAANLRRKGSTVDPFFAVSTSVNLINFDAD